MFTITVGVAVFVWKVSFAGFLTLRYCETHGFFMIKGCDRFLYLLVTFTPEYSPHVRGSQFFSRLEKKITESRHWEEEIEISRNDFEEIIRGHEDLEMAYIDLYSTQLKFFKLQFRLKSNYYMFYAVRKNGEDILIFFEVIF